MFPITDNFVIIMLLAMGLGIYNITTECPTRSCGNFLSNYLSTFSSEENECPKTQFCTEEF